MVFTASASARVAVEPVEVRDDRALVRDGDVGAAEAEGREALDRGAHVGGPHRQRHVDAVEPERREGRVVERRRQRVRDRVADDADDLCACR